MAVTVMDILAISSMQRARLAAGRKGLKNPVGRVNVLDSPDVPDFLVGQEFLFTSGYLLARDSSLQEELVGRLARRGGAALAVVVGRFLKELPDCMIQEAEAVDLPLIVLPQDYSLEEGIRSVIEQIIAGENGELESRRREHWQIDEHIRALAVWDEANNTDLLHTLAAYFAHNENPAETARALFISRNELKEQLARIEELTGLSLEKAEDWARLYTGILAYQAQTDRQNWIIDAG